MTRCVEFYTKWEQDPNWCEHSKSSCSRINAYMDLACELEEKFNFPKELTFVNLPEGAARRILSIKTEKGRDSRELLEAILPSIIERMKFKSVVFDGKRRYRPLTAVDVNAVIDRERAARKKVRDERSANYHERRNKQYEEVTACCDKRGIDKCDACDDVGGADCVAIRHKAEDDERSNRESAEYPERRKREEEAKAARVKEVIEITNREIERHCEPIYQDISNLVRIRAKYGEDVETISELEEKMQEALRVEIEKGGAKK